MATAQEKKLIKEACTKAFQEEMAHVFKVLFGVYVNNPATEAEALNRARNGMNTGLKTLQACVKLADELP
jgi:hypothetical protein